MLSSKQWLRYELLSGKEMFSVRNDLLEESLIAATHPSSNFQSKMAQHGNETRRDDRCTELPDSDVETFVSFDNNKEYHETLPYRIQHHKPELITITFSKSTL